MRGRKANALGRPSKKQKIQKQGTSMIAIEARRELVEEAVRRSILRRKANKNMEPITTVAPAVLGKNIKFFKSKEDYLTMKKAWASVSGIATADMHMFYNLLRGFGPRRGFSEVKSKVKLANGAAPWYTADMTSYMLRYQLNAWLMEPERKFWAPNGSASGKDLAKTYLSVFGPTVTPEIALAALKLIQ
jgi:hypothetical protein